MLLQTWIPDSSINVSLNGVAWYLSVTLFLYFMFPYVKKWIKNKADRVLLVVCALLLVLEIVVCVPFIVFAEETSPTYIWFMYCFPVFRLGDFFVGCCLGKIYKVQRCSSSSFSYSVYEILATALTVMVFTWMKQKPNNLILQALQNWTTIYIPLAAIWVLLFFKGKGIITRVLTNRATVFLGDISAYIFLIHYVVTQYFWAGLSFLDWKLSFKINIIKIAIELVCSIIATLCYIKGKKLIGNIGKKFLLRQKESNLERC